MKEDCRSYLDKKQLGRLMRSARIKAGYDSAQELVNALEEKTGFVTSNEIIYKIERGERAPQLDLWAAIQQTIYLDEVHDPILKTCFKRCG